MFAAVLLCCLWVQETPSPNLFEPSSFFELSPEMKHFLDENVMLYPNEYTRYNALITSIFDENGMGMSYSNNSTTIPKETFRLRSGNCLSFTAMFISMARYCGFDCRFQEVYDLSSWTQKGNLTVFNRHMNCLLVLDGRRKEIDFNYYRKRESRFTFPVTDLRGIAHFYNNLGAEQLSLQNGYLAKVYFEKSVETDPSFSYGWTNLGVLHRINGSFDLAEDCYKRAAKLNKLDHTAVMNLVHLYNLQGKTNLAQRYEKRAKKMQEKNPFYHYALGKEAYNTGHYEAALKHLNNAVRLNDTHPEFLLSLAAVYQKTGRQEQAEELIAHAKLQAETYEAKALYDRKLQLIAGAKANKQ